MNEISSFIAGERGNNEICPPAEPDSPPPVKPEIDDSTYLPFSVAGEGMNLANKTLTMSA